MYSRLNSISEQQQLGGGGGGRGINKNGIVTLGKIRRLPRGGTVLICTVIKRAPGAREARP